MEKVAHLHSDELRILIEEAFDDQLLQSNQLGLL